MNPRERFEAQLFGAVQALRPAGVTLEIVPMTGSWEVSIEASSVYATPWWEQASIVYATPWWELTQESFLVVESAGEKWSIADGPFFTLKDAMNTDLAVLARRYWEIVEPLLKTDPSTWPAPAGSIG